MKKRKFNWLPIIVLIVVAAIAGLSYSLYVFYSSGAAEKGIVVCDPQNPTDCLWQDHIHSLVIISIDGNVQDLPIEKGALDKAHTHEEKNILHWHNSLPYDPLKQEVIDKTPLTLKNSLNSIGVALPEGGRLFVKKSGSWNRITEYGEYVWSDGDIIFIAKDSRSDDEILAYLNFANINLPFLGAG